MERCCLAALFAIAACDEPSTAIPDAGGTSDAKRYDAVNLEVVGHVDLDMDANLGLTLAGNHAYVGHRNDGKVDIVDISDPAAPVRVGELDAGFNPTELHAIPDLARLYVLGHFGALSVFDISNPLSPQLISEFSTPNTIGHEFFLWRDPMAPSRVLLLLSDVSTNGGFAVLDVSDANAITVHHRQTASPWHSVSLSDDGTRMYVSRIAGAIAVMESTQALAAGDTTPATVLGTAVVSACVEQSTSCIAHSMVKVPGRSLAVVTTENVMCPKGGMDIVDLADETMPRRIGSWVHPKATLCGNAEPNLGAFGYGAHNPTVTANLALVSWYRAGFLMFDISDPAAPAQVASFVPVERWGSRLEWGSVASVSYPIIKGGLIYVVDGVNGLDIFRYTGPHREEIDGVSFLEGNSNL